MARIELKNCNLFMRDGFSGAAAVDNVAGYAAAAVTMAVDGFTGIIPLTTTFTVPGSNRIHRVSATTETLGDTTSITFSPGLAGAVVDNAVITLRGRSVFIKVGDGSINYDSNRAYLYDLDRGLIDTVREGDQVPMDITLDLIYEYIRSVTAATPTVVEAIYREGNASVWENADADPCTPYAVDIVVEFVATCGGVAPEVTILPAVRFEKVAVNTKDAKITGTGKSNSVRPTITRPA